MEIDDVYHTIGAFGRSQIYFFVLAGLMIVPAAFINLGIVFLNGQAKYRCAVPSLESLNLTEEDILNVSIPQSYKDGSLVWSQCYMYDRNFTSWTIDDVIQDLHSSSNKSGWPVKRCQSWTYDTSVFKSTIVTKWDLVCENEWLQATASSAYMAGLFVGSFTFGMISDLFGRKVSLIISTVLNLIAVMISPFSPNYIVFVILRFCASTSNFLAIFVLLIELIGPSMRAVVSYAYDYFWVLGYIILAGLGYMLRDFFTLHLALSCPAIILVIISCILPESPRWLYSKGKTEKAKRILSKMAKINKKNLPKQLDIYVQKKTQTATILDLVKTTSMRKRSFNLFFNWFVNSMVYYGLTLYPTTFGGNIYVNFLISGLIELPAYIFCQLTANCAGRRLLLASTMTLGGLTLLATLLVPKDQGIILIALPLAGKFFISSSFAIVYTFTAELYPTVVRNIGLGACSMAARVSGIVAPYIGQLGTIISPIVPMITFGAFSVSAGLLALLLPETKDTNLPETIDDVEVSNKKGHSHERANADTELNNFYNTHM